MFYNKNILLILLFITISSETSASIKNDIIKNLQNIENVSFNFEQNINGKIESGECTIKYPKKIFCSYNLNNKKILVSNGRSLVIKTLNSYYIYPITRTPLDIILNKKFLLDKIKNLKGRKVNDKLINYRFIENENEINLFFDKYTYNLVGRQTLDLYQNLSITYLNSIIKNKNLEEDLFTLPTQN